LWAYSLKDKGIFEQGEILEAIDAASAVGDDSIQKRSTGEIHPESWTHGSSNDRAAWFNKGYETGSVVACDTFSL
jgi:predicted metalloprotease